MLALMKRGKIFEIVQVQSAIKIAGRMMELSLVISAKETIVMP
jgi:hypothetical protein